MVCIAAFIILIIIGLFIAIISIFKREVGKTYLKMMKKAWGCVGKKVRLQKCETGFKEDVKNTVLSRVIIKHPTWVKPLSVIIEVVSIVIVVVAVWALLTAIKSLLALWALGTCNVTKPAACSLGAEVCSIDESEPTNIIESTGRWFTEWGEIFAAIPDKFRDYNPENFNFITIGRDAESDKKLVVDILDPGCSVCMDSFKNQLNSNFFDENNVQIVVYPIQNPDGSYKFANSGIITRYVYAADQAKQGLGFEILKQLFTGKDENGFIYQALFNNEYDADKAAAVINDWLKAAGVDEVTLTTINTTVNSYEINKILDQNKSIIEEDLHLRGIPTVLIDGAKKTGRFEVEK